MLNYLLSIKLKSIKELFFLNFNGFHAAKKYWKDKILLSDKIFFDNLLVKY